MGLTDDVIFRALKLSYHDLSARLKQLFAYFSLFPKDFLFDRDELVLLWMAEGYLHPSTPRNLTAEQMGHEYFEELVSRSFFQHAPNNESLFVMHDLMNDLATFVASEFFIRLGNETEKTIRKEMLEKYLHMSFVRETYVTYKKFEAFTRAKSLRTFLATSVGEVNSWWHFYLSNKILVDLLFELPWIRVLCLSGFDIREVPESIGTLIHLRYLNLSRTRITYLPENVCSLYNLQTLTVFGCNELTKLPDNFFKLRNLRYLDIRDTPLLKKMPLRIGDLKNLQTLSKIIIEGESGLVITKLKDLENLCGKVSIMGLEKVENTIDARMAKFSQKKLSELEVVWSDEPYDLQNEMLEKEVLNEMKPRNEKLRKLKISSYGGLEFPIWVGEPSFLQLKHVSIRGCKKCTSLPPLGQLPLLKELFVGGLERVKVVGMELLGNGCAFYSLETLNFFNMQGWEKWSTNIGVVFPCLRELHISECPNLIEVTLEALPSLNVLELYTCDSGVLRTLVQIASPITKLDIISISGLNDAVWRGVIEYLGAVEYIRIMRCNEIGYLWESELIASKVLAKLKELVVNQCDNLVSLGERVEEEDGCSRNLLTSLRVLYVRSCVKLVCCSFPDGIERLRVNSCHSITASPTIGQKLKSLELINCRQVLERERGGQKIHNSGSTMLPLEYVWIVCWPNLKSVTELTYLVHFTTLRISNCANLESFPDNELSNMTSLKYLEITSCPRMDASFPRGVWPPNLCSLEIGKLKKPITEWGPQNFPSSLVRLYLYGNDNDGVSSCSQFSHLLSSSLTSLHIEKFEKLESFSTGLQHLTSLEVLSFNDCGNLKKVSSHHQQPTSLQHLIFTNCPNMMDLPETLLPSLLTLRIQIDCPKLKERCSKRGCYWPLISDIRCIDTERA